MVRQVFYSFRYKLDSWRVSQVKKIGAVEGQPVLHSNDWEQVKRGGDPAVRAWIAREMSGKSCDVVLIGAHTDSRRWVEYEIKKAWADRKGVIGIHIHKLLDQDRRPTVKGASPFTNLVTPGGTRLGPLVPVWDPPGATSTDAFAWIRDNISACVEEGIRVRNRY